MHGISPLCSEWLRALFMPVAGILMIALGMRMSGLTERIRNGLSVGIVFLTIVAMATHYQPLRPIFGSATERLGGEAAVIGFLLLMLVGIARARMRTAMLNIGICLAFTIISISAFFPLYWHYLNRKPFSNYSDKSGNIQQTTGFTCAPAAASMLLSRYGIRVSEGMLAERAGTNPIFGTNEYSLIHALESATSIRALKASAEHLSYQQACALSRPFVAYILIPSIGGHAVLVDSLNSDKALISDPLTGSSDHISINEFRQEWQGTAIWMSEPK